MKGPYQIYRTELKDEHSGKPKMYRHEIINIVTNVTVDYAFSPSPIAPRKMRAYQASLNTKALMD